MEDWKGISRERRRDCNRLFESQRLFSGSYSLVHDCESTNFGTFVYRVLAMSPAIFGLLAHALSSHSSLSFLSPSAARSAFRFCRLNFSPFILFSCAPAHHLLSIYRHDNLVCSRSPLSLSQASSVADNLQMPHGLICGLKKLIFYHDPHIVFHEPTPIN